MQELSSECGNTGRCLASNRPGVCYMNLGCVNFGDSCTFPNGKAGSCYGNVCFMQCDESADCPANINCVDDAQFGRRMCLG